VEQSLFTDRAVTLDDARGRRPGVATIRAVWAGASRDPVARCRVVGSAITVLLFAAVVVTPALAQTTPASLDRPTIGVTLPASVLRDLPGSANLFSILETTLPEVVSDRFNSGGLNAGAPARIGAFLASWRQTQYRIGDANIASPITGAPLLFPDLAFWQQMQVTTGLMPIDVPASGLAVSLEPRRPSAHWTGSVEGVTSRGVLTTRTAAREAPAIARLDDWTHGSALFAGPVARRLGLVIGGSWSPGSSSSLA